MTVGFSCHNDDNNLLINSELHSMHFCGKFTSFQSSQIPELMEGPGNKSFGPNENKNMNNMPDRGYIYKFRVPRSYSDTRPPMCFIKPSSTGSSAPYQAIILTKKITSYWEIWVFSSKGVSYKPKLYCFQTIPSFKTTNTVYKEAMGDQYGWKNFNANGEVTFDSRFKPLRIIDGGTINSPSTPHTGSRGSGWTAKLDVNATTKTTRIAAAETATDSDLIYYCPSIAHGCNEYQYSASDSGTYDWESYAWARSDLWWIFTRVGYRLRRTSGGTLYFESQHGVYARGHVWAHESDSSSILTAVVVGIVTGGVGLAAFVGAIALLGGFTSNDVAEGGYLPYSNGSRNTHSVGFAVSKASYYD